MPVRAVFFDIGETLISEERIWNGWADWLGVPRHTFLAAFGSIIERGEPNESVLQLFREGFDLEAEEEARRRAGKANAFDSDDLYPDVLPCLQALRSAGYVVGLAGNQPAWALEMLQTMALPVDAVGLSDLWGVRKPAPAFFHQVVQLAGVPGAGVAYVGDRLDNDVLPARAAGLTAVFLRRGPWGVIHSRQPEANRAHITIDSLTELPDALRGLR